MAPAVLCIIYYYNWYGTPTELSVFSSGGRKSSSSTRATVLFFWLMTYFRSAYVVSYKQVNPPRTTLDQFHGWGEAEAAGYETTCTQD